MTKDLAALVAKLRAPAYWMSGSSEGHEGENDAPRAAADAIEAQADENERLRNALETLGVGLDHLGLITSPMKVAVRAALEDRE